VEARQLLPVETAGGTERMQLRVPERLVDVDVPEPGQCPLVEQRRLEGEAKARP